MCVQRFDDSLNSAIHITYRISLRSSSLPEPRDPLLKVLIICLFTQAASSFRVWDPAGGPARDPVAPKGGGKQGVVTGAGAPCYPVMILPQVHLRKPCYDFYFL
jgi:hypothetical protein